MPKSTIKTNLEGNGLFYLRHLISMDREISIPFVIISHMRMIMNNKRPHLPYSHIIARILEIHQIGLPQNNRISPSNLYTELPNMRFLKDPIEINRWISNAKPVNQWIRADGAAVNQFYGPPGTVVQSDDEGRDEASIPPSGPGGPSTRAQNQTQHPFTQAEPFIPSGDWMDPPTTGNINDNINYVVNQMAFLSYNFMEHRNHCTHRFDNLDERLTGINTRVENLENITNNLVERITGTNTRVESLENFNNNLSVNWSRTHGSWYTPNATFDDVDFGVGSSGGNDGEDEIMRDAQENTEEGQEGEEEAAEEQDDDGDE